MSRRVSAGELEDRYKIKHALYDFFCEMKAELMRHAEDKGRSWRKCHPKYLLRELMKHAKEGDWVGVANFAFFLRDLEINKED